MLARPRLLALSLAASAAAACGTVISPADTGAGGNDGGPSPDVYECACDVPPDRGPDAGTPTDVQVIDVAPADTRPPPSDGGPLDVPPARDVQFSDVQTDAPPQYPQRGGVVQISMQSFGSFGSNSSAAAAFYEDFTQVIPGNCTQRTAGNCTLLQCTNNGGADAGTPAFISAGDVTVRAAGVADVTLTPGANNQYMGFNDMSAYWAPGSALSVSAAGATVPAFATSLTFPADLNVTDPVVANPFTDRVQIDRSAGLVVQWTPVDGVVTVTIFQQSNNALGAQLACTFPGSDGGGAIPPSALADLSPSPPTSTQPDTYLIAGGSSSAEANAGGYTVDVTAQNMTFFAGAQVR